MIFIGFIIGFIGYLPPGNINLTVVQMSIGKSKDKVWYFILFAAFMEFVYCFGSLVGMKFLLQQPAWITGMKWASVVVFSLLGILTFSHRSKGPEHRSFGLGRGIVIAIVNPMQVPFWLIWGAYALQSHWVLPSYPSISLFSLITASGTITILWLYETAGRKLEETLKARERLMNLVIGSIFTGLAVYQLVNLLRHG